jgi:tryptophan synthase alpha chain
MSETFKAKMQKCPLIPFLVAGDPSVAATERFVDGLVAQGVELLELGVPFSDALADGPVIQAASERASRTLDSIGEVLALAGRIHARHPQLGIILFTYYNPIFRHGIERFAADARANGIAAVLVVDLPPESAGDYRLALAREKLGTIFLASPTTDPTRLPIIAEASTAFVYYVSRTGVTGERADLPTQLEAELARLRAFTNRPIAVGFGISNAEQAQRVGRVADGVVVGSAFVRIIAENPEVDTADRKIRDLAFQMTQKLFTD